MSQYLKFQNKNNFKLSAHLEIPADGQTKAYAIFAHCFTCSKNLNAVRYIAKSLNAQGIAVLRFDFTGLGQSEGNFADTNFSSNVDDLVAAANFMTENFAAPQILVGHSLGGAAVLQAAHYIESARAIVTIGAPCNPTHVTHLLKSELETIQLIGKANVELAGREFVIKKQFLDDLNEVNMKDAIANLDKALLVMHAPLDNTVGISNAADIFKTAKHPKSFISLDGADHLLTSENDAKYAGTVIAGWVTRYLAIPHLEIPQQETNSVEKELAESAVSKDSIPQGTVVVYTTQDYRSEVYTNNHHFVIDEPINIGGTDTGPSPFENLAAALGACKTITVRMYADRKQLPLEAITARVQLKSEIKSDGSKKSCFHVELSLKGKLNEKQCERMLQIADRCPVQKILVGEIEVETRLG